MLNKIKNNSFYKSTIILLLGGILGKTVGFLIRIIVTRTLGARGMGLYSLLSPTISLLNVLAIFSYPNAISKIVSEESSRTKNLLISIIPISIIINVIFIIFMVIFAPYLSNTLLKEKELYLPIISIALTMPFISVSSIIKGYFWGKQNMYPYMLSNFIEQIVRLIFIILFLNSISNINLTYSICFIILINIIGEISSQIIMIRYFPKYKLSFEDIKISIFEINKIMKFCIPTTLSKIIGSVAYFLEPIILTHILLKIGYTDNYIVYEYGVVNAYALSTLLIPQFFTQNMATSLIPELSKNYSLNNIELCKKRIKQIVLISCFIGGLSTLFITIFPNFFLRILYNTSEGIDYIRLLSPFTILFYIEYPLNNALQALGKAKETFNIVFISSVIRILSIIIFSIFKIGMYSLIISIIINLLCSTLLYYREIKKVLII